MSFEDNFNKAVKDFLVRNDRDVCTVTDYHEQRNMSGSYSVWISFLDKAHDLQYFRYGGSFADLIRELTLE